MTMLNVDLELSEMPIFGDKKKFAIEIANCGKEHLYFFVFGVRVRKSEIFPGLFM